MKKCGNNKCKTMLSDGSPELCPKCQERGVCPACRGYKRTVRVHNEALTPSVKEGKCKTCNGKGRVARPSNGGTQRPGTQDATIANPDALPGSLK